jgi:putative glutamine amidotransferase
VRPLVGVTSSVGPVTHGAWQDEAVHVPVAYVRCLTAAGAGAVVLPPDGVDASVLDGLDGLVVAGGGDVDPSRYGQRRHPCTADLNPRQDEVELALVAEALARDVPVLGICRGMQVLAVAHGGSLHQHLPDLPDHATHGAWAGGWSDHRVHLAAGSRVAGLLGESLTTNSGHHQGVADAGTLTVTGHTDDGLVEAVEHPGHPFCLGVQWHPEMVGHQALFDALVAAVGVPVE